MKLNDVALVRITGEAVFTLERLDRGMIDCRRYNHIKGSYEMHAFFEDELESVKDRFGRDMELLDSVKDAELDEQMEMPFSKESLN